MKELISSLPAQISKGIELGSKQKIERPYRNIISCGMGGSAIAGEMLSMVSDNVIVHWDYDLPAQTSSQDLVICTSWSGDTEEVISSFEAAKRLGCDILTITSGGKLAELAQANNSPLILLPKESNLPRMESGLMTGALFAALDMQQHLPTELKPENIEAKGKELAESIGDRMLVVYSSYPWRKLTGFWKMTYSETAKRQVITNWFPSGAHSEIVGWEGPYKDKVSFLFLEGSDSSAPYSKNFKALLAILPEKGYNVFTVELSGNAPLEKAFNNYILALWTSYYVAQSLGIDPAATEFLDEFKRLKSAF